jgi:L-threonylcarbamoyladenylate synthase
METKYIDINNLDSKIIRYAADVLSHGGVVVFPTDTSYGLAADPANEAAMKKLYAIKARNSGKPVSCIFKSIDQAQAWAKMDDRAEKILHANLPGPYTFLLAANTRYPLGGDLPALASKVGLPRLTRVKAGVRIPDFPVTSLLAELFDKPYTATSANLAGEPPAYSIAALMEQLKNESTLPDLILDVGTLPQNPPSTIVDLTGPEPAIIRKGGVRPVLSV